MIRLMLQKKECFKFKEKELYIVLQWTAYSRRGIFNLQCILELADASAPRINNEAHVAPKEL